MFQQIKTNGRSNAAMRVGRAKAGGTGIEERSRPCIRDFSHCASLTASGQGRIIPTIGQLYTLGDRSTGPTRIPSMKNTDDEAELQLQTVLESIDACYRERGIFQDRFGFGVRPAIVVVDFAYGWTDDAYAGASRRLDAPVEKSRELLDTARPRKVPVIYTTSPYRPESGDQPFKTAADKSAGFRPWDRRAVEIDARVAPRPGDLVLEKDN